MNNLEYCFCVFQMVLKAFPDANKVNHVATGETNSIINSPETLENSRYFYDGSKKYLMAQDRNRIYYESAVYPQNDSGLNK